MNKILNNPGLEAMFFPLSLDTFKQNHWPARPAFAKRTNDHFKSLITETPLFELFNDIRTLNKVSHAPEVEVFANTKEPHALTVTPMQAYELFEKGLVTIRLRAVHTWITQIDEWLLNIATDLKSTPIREAYATVYISPSGFTGVPHFDGHEVFIAQLFGQKEWSYCRCQALSYPCAGYKIGDNSSSVPLKFGISSSDLPKHMPSDNRQVSLTPGCSLFLPRGYFHQTHTKEKSLHITFGLETFNWLEIFLEHIRKHLLLEQEWRELPVGLLGERQQFACAKQIFQEKLKDIQKKVASFQDDKIIDEILLDLRDKLQK